MWMILLVVRIWVLFFERTNKKYTENLYTVYEKGIQQAQQDSWDNWREWDSKLPVLLIDDSRQNIVQQPSDKDLSQEIKELLAQQESVRENLSVTELEALSEDTQQRDKDMTTHTLMELYETTDNESILVVLLEKLVDQHSYDTAFTYLQQGEQQQQIDSLSAYTYLTILFNSRLVVYKDQKNLTKIQQRVEEFMNLGQITQSDYLFYMSLIDLLHGYTNKFVTKISQINDLAYQPFMSALDEYDRHVHTQVDVPSYYFDALISLLLLQNGYVKVAQQRAIHIAIEDGNYILPHQILWYSNFILHNRDASGEYFRDLVVLDPTNSDVYTFMRGVWLYWQKQYKQAIIAFNQVQNENFQSDAYRYMLLSYDQLGDEENFMRIAQRLLWYDDLVLSDFIVFFEKVLYLPRSREQDAQLYVRYTSLVEQYLLYCDQQVRQTEMYVCDYGRAGVLLVEWKIVQAEQYLRRITEYLQKSYLYHALGEVAIQRKNFDEAKQRFVKALLITDNDTQKNLTKQRLFGILPLLK